MANKNAMKFTIWTDSGTKIESNTAPILRSLAFCIERLTPAQRAKLETWLSKQVEKDNGTPHP